MNKKDNDEIGLCECGCGEKTKISSKNDKSKGWIKGTYRRFAVGHHSRVLLSGNKSPRWKGGITFCQGYKLIKIKGHPRSVRGGYVREHIIMAEIAVGGPLPAGCEVHHHKSRGDNSSLVICPNAAYHKLLHTRAKAFYACGDVEKRQCKYCKQYDYTDNMYVDYHNGRVGAQYHRKCRNEYLQNKKQKMEHMDA